MSRVHVDHDVDPSCREHVREDGSLIGDCMAPETVDGALMVWCEVCTGWVRPDLPCPRIHSEPSPSDQEALSSTEVDSGSTDDALGPQISESTDALVRFLVELQRATGDGARKRQAGSKPPWYQDDSHEAAIFSHLTKWKRGELVDPDSGAHPLVHAAWRCLAIACRESGNNPEGDTPSQ